MYQLRQQLSHPSLPLDAREFVCEKMLARRWRCVSHQAEVEAFEKLIELVSTFADHAGIASRTLFAPRTERGVAI